MKKLKGHSSNVFSVVFSPNGGYLASGSMDHSIGVWNLLYDESIKFLIGHTF